MLNWSWGDIGKWALIAVALSPIWFAIGFSIYEGNVRPAFIPNSEIERLADEITCKKPDDSEEAAYWEEYAAWHRSDSFEQSRWWRVRRVLRARSKRVLKELID